MFEDLIRVYETEKYFYEVIEKELDVDKYTDKFALKVVYKEK